jgi:hypothetical protein
MVRTAVRLGDSKFGGRAGGGDDGGAEGFCELDGGDADTASGGGYQDCLTCGLWLMSMMR